MSRLVGAFVCPRGVSAIEYRVTGQGIEVLRAFDQPAQRQLWTSGRLHAVTGTGTAVLGVKPHTSVQEIVELLAFAWRQTDIARLRLQVWPRPSGEQPAALLPE